MIAVLLTACSATLDLTIEPTPAPPQVKEQVAELAQDCTPTSPDMEGPFYEPGAPERSTVGTGFVLSGVVRSTEACTPIPGAKIEFWMAGPNGEYADEFRATLFAGEDGSYRFESHPPPPYSGRPPHIHLRLSAPGFATLITQHYPQPGQDSAMFDLVLLPE
jgi:protocatechuate 3,4-dioxygenase beta subunit